MHALNANKKAPLRLLAKCIVHYRLCLEHQVFNIQFATWKLFKFILLVFGQISGLKVNLDKSNLFGINLDQDHLTRLALMLDCEASD